MTREWRLTSGVHGQLSFALRVNSVWRWRTREWQAFCSKLVMEDRSVAWWLRLLGPMRLTL